MHGHVTSSANGQLYTIKINKDLLVRLLKRGDGRTKYSVEVASRLKRDATVVEKVKEEVCLKMCMVGRSVKIYYKNVQYTHIRGVP